MRLIQISVPESRRSAVLDVLSDRQLGYTAVESADREDHVIVNFVLPADAVEHVLDDLTDAGLDRSTFTVSIDAEFASFEGIDEVQNRWANTPNKIAPATLRSKAKDMRRSRRSFLWMMVLSAVVATAGLLMSSPAVVVGSMVIAPIVSPALTASVGAVRNDREMFIDSVHMQALGLGVAIVSATAFGMLVSQLQVVPAQMSIANLELVSLRFSPSTLSLAVGLSAGAAAAYGLATKGRTTIVGVMIAAALIPTAAAVGIAITWGNRTVAIGAFLLLVLNLAAVNVGGTAMLLYLEYRPDGVDESILAVDSLGTAIVVGGTVLGVILLTAGVGVAAYQQSSYERTVNGAVTDVLDEGEYSDLGVREITVDRAGPSPFLNEGTVTVTLTRTSEESYESLPDELDRRISDRVDGDVTVAVEFADLHRSDA